ncbi:MAG: Eco57I restriction-modification methylase domain-containing protein [Thermodesulfobacteriota bacterium]|nr:Eco57I restriction-modification methylase domain-containing protein [Thermodesulfobacteriota bacterium]
MAPNLTRTRKLLATSDFKTLFIEELGWNHHTARLELSVDGLTFKLYAVAEKCGMAAFVCDRTADGRIPDYAMRRKIERQVTKRAHEHLIIFIDGKRTMQVWQWVRREQGKPAACREHTYLSGQPGDSLIQKLQALAVSLEEEECLTLTDVTGRARKAFDVERITKRFYDRFKAEHAAFLKFLEGIPDEEMERWYVSVMLDRLMFIYFIQKKGFLDNDTDYLKNKLAQCRNELGKDRYYRDFLCPLFFEGFAKRKEERSDKAEKLLGEVPYLNGGIFMPHQVEQLYGKTISIPDKAFEKLFEFFEAYQWHLDDRPTSKDNEIRPDVLGYIFEKYINQKQMGAYYTKEDITEYISKNTVIPFLFDAAKEKCRVAFEGDRPVWRLLQEDPDRYIYEAVRRGVVTQEGNIIPESILPEFVQKGMHDPRARMFNKDYNLGRANVIGPDGVNLTLPTETWREYAQRRERCLELKRKFTAGEVRDINDLITFNLDIRQFAQDVIENCEGPELLVAFWKAIEGVTVLDPTCGSGAFLFAALNILEPLYEACLERMRFFLEEWGESAKKSHPNYYKLFKETLKRVEDHPNPRYFIFKSIIVNSLYGVDLMEEAVEICKLRLFLKLVAQIERVEDIEPLPDIDFNIRAGNTLVGFVSLEEIRKAAERDITGQQRIVFGETASAIRRIEEEAEVADRAFRKFREMQTEQGMSPSDFVEAKENLRTRLKKLTDELDHFLAREYGVDMKKKGTYENWRKFHQPFHWFAEFYGILKAGGFDVIIGNPPYVEYRNIMHDYTVRMYETESCGNLYAFVLDRSFALLKQNGKIGMIVPISITCSERMSPLRKRALSFCSKIWVSNFAIRPQPLFAEIMQRNTIFIGHMNEEKHRQIFSTNYLRWTVKERDYLLRRLRFTDVLNTRATSAFIPKVATNIEMCILKNFANTIKRINQQIGARLEALYFHDSGESYWTKTLWEKPNAYRNGKRVDPAQWFLLGVHADDRPFIYLLLNSNLLYWLWTVWTDCRHMTKGFLESVTLPASTSIDINLVEKLRQAYSENTSFFEKRHGYKSPEIKVQKFKPVIDEIDSILARHYGFTDEELDFIINYDIKYRMGQEGSEGSEE